MKKVYAVDFDGTLCKDDYPGIGKAKKHVIKFLIGVKNDGDKLILWTCRRDERLRDAVEWSRLHGLEFDAVNENLPENVMEFGGDTRKVYANYYLDDKNVSMGGVFIRGVPVKRIAKLCMRLRHAWRNAPQNPLGMRGRGHRGRTCP